MANRFETIVGDVRDERKRQDDKWGKQMHPMGTSAKFKPLADSARNSCRKADAAGANTWFHIAREEFFEMAAETDWPNLRAEAVQLAAVLFAMIECGDEQNA